MNQSQVYGYHGEGHILCLSCAGRIYGTSVEKYVEVGDLQTLEETERWPYREKGLMCDECSNWIFPPAAESATWWREEPAVEQHLRLLAPFVVSLERFGVDVSNLREIAAARPGG